MSSNRLKLASALVCLHACVALAQDADALARAKRDAGNPLRMIIEAGKLKPRQKTADGATATRVVAEAVIERPPTGRPAAVSALLPQAAAPEQAPPSPTLQTLPPSPAQLPSEPSALATPPMQEAAPASLPAVSAPTPEAEAEALQKPVAQPALPAAPTPTFVAVPAPSTALQLADYVEPTLPERVRRRLHGNGEVVVGFTVHPDGSVTDASVSTSSDKALDAIVLDAVRQWRYRPIAAAQAHAVQLVFKLHD